MIEMSQSHNQSRDSQAMLQSMLQRLKLQAGVSAHVDSSNGSTLGQDADRETSDFQTFNRNPINGSEPTADINRECAINGEIQELQRPGEDSGASGHNKELISSEGCARFDNSATKKDMSGDPNAGETTEQNQGESNDFVPRVYTWSAKNTEPHDRTQVSFVGGGVFGDMGQSTQTTVSSSKNITNNRKQRSSENKTRKWTQRIKEKWRDRPGSFGKKGREDRESAEQTNQKNLPQYQAFTTGNLIPTSDEDSGVTLASVDSTDYTKSLHTRSEDGTNEEHRRSTIDFDFGLGSFSLLDEIVRGQEWAKFINPTIPVSANQKPTEDSIVQPLINHDAGFPQEFKNSPWMFGTSTEHIGWAQTLPASKDVTEKVQGLSKDQSEPMDHGHSPLKPQTKLRQQQQLRTSSPAEPADTVVNITRRTRNALSRKRQYQPFESIDTKLQMDTSNGSEPEDDGSVFLPDNHMVHKTDGSQHEDIMMLSPSTSTPRAPLPRGVLKHTISHDSVTSMETVIKRRRVEEKRRVHFSEEIIAFAPPELGPDATDSEEASEEEEEEEDSVIEEDCKEEQAESVEEVVQARRHALPSWIRALKKKKSRKKPR